MKDLMLQVVGADIYVHITRSERSTESYSVENAQAAIDEAKKHHSALGYPSTVRVYTNEGKFYLDLLDDADVLAFILKYSA
jgi:hypothetical protein